MQANNVQEYIDIIERLKQNYTYFQPPMGLSPNHMLFKSLGQTIHPDFIYRGHGNHKKYKILPGIFRNHTNPDGSISGDYSQMELNILNDFISEACRFIRDISIDDIAAWIEIAQHFGVPTRLLDFTQNPLVALYFACSSLSDAEASVWIINVTAYNQVFYNLSPGLVPTVFSRSLINKIIQDEIIQQDYGFHNDQNFYHQYPWIYKPYYREDRMNQQSSIFMLWGANRNELTSFMQSHLYMNDSEQVSNYSTGVIGFIQIPADKKKILLNQLNLLGINEKMIYPGLDGIGNYIRKKYSFMG